MKFGIAWAIPRDAVRPADKRIKSGKTNITTNITNNKSVLLDRQGIKIRQWN